MKLIRTSRQVRGRRGFTLLETGLATIIIGLAVTSLMQLLAKGTVLNIEGADLTTAINLANNVHELTYGLTFVDPNNPTNWGPEGGETLATYSHLDDFSSQTFSPPIDARRQSLANYGNWTQVVTASKVDINRLTTGVPNSTVMPAAKVTVTILHFGNAVYSESWLIAQGQ